MCERLLGNSFAVHDRSEARRQVSYSPVTVPVGELGVHPRDVGAWYCQVGAASAAERKVRLIDRRDPSAERVVDDETGTAHVGKPIIARTQEVGWREADRCG